ncbi:hypothetical protein [Ligilactobacillus apodemi]|uniref:hypothetical protein n=1 Tax=Ligilactobacillus apodemi TaxID=307126 RepID=UPI000688DE60|nr:hypothetical protein [Ligilactobacillus apodemi]
MNELYTYRNELKNKIIPKYKIIGITSELILSTKIFKNNKDLIPFLNDIFSISFRPYVIRSRTLTLARITRIIDSYSDAELFATKNKLYAYIGRIIETNDAEH